MRQTFHLNAAFLEEGYDLQARLKIHPFLYLRFPCHVPELSTGCGQKSQDDNCNGAIKALPFYIYTTIIIRTGSDYSPENISLATNLIVSQTESKRAP